VKEGHSRNSRACSGDVRQLGLVPSGAMVALEASGDVSLLVHNQETGSCSIVQKLRGKLIVEIK